MATLIGQNNHFLSCAYAKRAEMFRGDAKVKLVLTLYDILGWIKRSSCLESEKGRSMNPLLTQKIEWGVRLKSDEIVGERKQPIPGKEVDGGGSGERETKRAHSSSLPRPADAAALPRTY